MYVALEPLPETRESPEEDTLISSEEVAPEPPPVEPIPKDSTLQNIQPTTTPQDADPDRSVSPPQSAPPEPTTPPPGEATQSGQLDRSAQSPPPPPRERSWTPPSISTTTPEDAALLASQIEEIAQLQEDYLADLSAWQERQQAGVSSEDAEDPLSPSNAEEVSSLRSFQDALSRAIEGIRQSENVVSTTPRDTIESGQQTANSNGSPIPGVSIDGGSGTRALVSGAPPDLRRIELPAGFPPEYVVSVEFDVDSDGWIRRAQVTRPTPAPQLDALLEATVESWRFEPAEGARTVRGSVTIVVDTTGNSATAR